MKNNIQTAIIKIKMLIQKMDSNWIPATAKTVSNTAVVMMAFLETNFLFCFSIFSVKAMNIGTLPTGLTTTNRDIIDFSISSVNVSEIANELKSLLYARSLN